jgi:hypothetical protein
MKPGINKTVSAVTTTVPKVASLAYHEMKPET